MNELLQQAGYRFVLIVVLMALVNIGSIALTGIIIGLLVLVAWPLPHPRGV